MNIYQALSWLCLWIAIGGAVGAALGASKDRTGAGFALGALLGIIGWIIVATLEPSGGERRRRVEETAQIMRAEVVESDDGSRRTCPWCAEFIKPAAVVCRFCGRDLPGPTS